MTSNFSQACSMIPNDWSVPINRELNALANQYFFGLLLKECEVILEKEQVEKIHAHINSGQPLSARFMIEPLAEAQKTNIDTLKDSLYLVAVLASLLVMFEDKFPNAFQAIDVNEKGHVILQGEVAVKIFGNSPAPQPILDTLPSITEMLRNMPAVVK